MLRTILFTAAMVAGSGAAFAQLQDENLLLGIPDGFVSGYDASQDGQEIHEFVPKGESVEEWSAMVTLQIFHGLNDLEGDRFAASMAEGWQGACPDARIGKLAADNVNGFPFVIWAYQCPLNPQTGKPEMMWFKGISGSDAFYSVQYAYRQPADDAREAAALSYLVGISACDTRKPERACPPGM